MIVPIQYLRGIAALLVVCFHLFYQWSSLSSEPIPALAAIGASGVDIFFVISGFIMWVTTAEGGVTTAEFYAKRLARIVPLYWIVTLAIVALMLAAPRLLNNSKFDIAHVASSLAFVAWPHPVATDKLYPVVIPGWTLNYEMFFYALFGLFLCVGRRGRLVGMILLLAALVTIGRTIATPGGRLDFYTAPIMLEFAFGMLVGALYRAAPSLNRRIALAIVCAGVAALTVMATCEGVDRVIAFGIPAAAIVFGALHAWGGGSAREWMPLSVIGAASYSIYLTQVVSLAAFRAAWHTAGLPVGTGWGTVFIVAGLAVATLGGLAAHVMLEDPLSRLVRPYRGVGARRARSPRSAELPSA